MPLNIFNQTIIEFTTFASIRLVGSMFALSSWSKCERSDETEMMRSILPRNIAQQLKGLGVSIIRLRGHGQEMIAVTRLFFPRIQIFVDYNPRSVSDTLREFVIAHELGHVRGRHPLVLLLTECLLVAVIVSIALKVSLATESVAVAIALGLTVILVGVFGLVMPTARFVSRAMEFDADEFAVKLVGVDNAVSALSELRGTGLVWRCDSIRSAVDERLAKIKLQLVK